MTVTTKLIYKDMPTTGLTGLGGEGGWTGDGDTDFLVEMTGTASPHEEVYIKADIGDLVLTKGINDTFVFTPVDVDDNVITTKDVDRVIFNDMALALDVNGPAGELYALLAAGLGASDITPDLVGIGLYFQDQGRTDTELAQLLLDSSLYKQDALGSSNETFVKHVYHNIFGQTISLTDLAFFTGALDRKEVTQAQLLEAGSNLVAFRDVTHINLVGLADTGIEYTPFVV